jgi:hypothetical protein
MNCPLCLSASTNNFFSGPNGDYIRCQNCDLIYLDSVFYLSPNDEKKRYDSHENDPADEKYRNYLISTFRHIQEEVSPNSKLLDFGCGPSEGMKVVLKELGYDCDSYDPFYFPQIILENNKYDGVILSESLEHFFDPKRDLETIIGLIKNNGKILIRTERHLGETHFQNWYYHKDPTHVIFFSINTFEFLAKHYNLIASFPDKNIVLLRRSSEA